MTVDKTRRQRRVHTASLFCYCYRYWTILVMFYSGGRTWEHERGQWTKCFSGEVVTIRYGDES